MGMGELQVQCELSTAGAGRRSVGFLSPRAAVQGKGVQESKIGICGRLPEKGGSGEGRGKMGREMVGRVDTANCARRGEK